MPDPDHDAEPERSTDPRFDSWPVRRYDAYENWPVESEAVEQGQDRGTVSDVEWVGYGGEGTAVLYATEGETLYEGELDHGDQRIRLREEYGGVQPKGDEDSGRTLGEHVEHFGEEHGWTWLSSFARDHLEDDREGVDYRERRAEDREQRVDDRGMSDHYVPQGFEHRYSEFQQRNLAESADVDAAFEGSHTFDDETGRVHILEREFGVTGEGASADIEVTERYLVAEDERAEERSGEADLVDEEVYELGVDVDPDALSWESEVEATLEEWHRTHLGPPAEPQRGER